MPIKLTPGAEAAGRLAFEAYNNAGSNPGKTWDGKPVPAWESLGDDVRAKWCAAALAVGTYLFGAM